MTYENFTPPLPEGRSAHVPDDGGGGDLAPPPRIEGCGARGGGPGRRRVLVGGLPRLFGLAGFCPFGAAMGSTMSAFVRWVVGASNARPHAISCPGWT